MSRRLKRILILSASLIALAGNAQSVLQIKDRKVVKPGETFEIPAGTEVVFGPGASILVEGSLKIKGSKSNPVVFRNEDNEKPGNGIQIYGIEENGEIVIEHTHYFGVIQALRFDPFWYRKSVSISNVKIRNASSFEPIIYVATPLIDLREGKAIDFKLKGSEFSNNASGVILESVGSDGIKYDIDKLYFSDNSIAGGDESFGMLHLDFTNSSNIKDVSIGDVAFERNYANNVPVGLSVSGSSNQNLTVNNVYYSGSSDVIFDQRKDSRVPKVNGNFSNDLTTFGKAGYIESITHEYGKLSAVTKGDFKFVELQDSFGRKVDYTIEKLGDTQMLNYIQGYPVFGLLEDGSKMGIPSIENNILPTLEITKTDTAEFNRFQRMKQDTPQTTAVEQSDVLSVGLNLPMFKKKGEVVRKLRVWEIGIWGGGAIYGGGDIKHKFAPIPSNIDLSLGLYGQYNFNSRFSARLSLYKSTISIHNLYSIGLFTGTLPLVVYNSSYQAFNAYPNSFPVHFTTNMWISEIEGLWHLRAYQIKEGKKGKLVPTLGLSLGIMHFTPYRYAYTNQRKKELYSDYKDRMNSEHKYNLRKLGSEGQYFLPNAKPYSTIAFNMGTSFSVTYLRKRFAYKGEFKFSYTSTDYLDDFGPGNWYGGDIDAMRANHQLGDIYVPDLRKISAFNTEIAPNTPRSTNGLNDWYFQLHLGVSYILFK